MAEITVFDACRARSVLDRACAAVGLDSGAAKLIRLGEKAVFRLGPYSIVARVGRRCPGLGDDEREVQVARWLADNSVPAVRALDVPQPILVEDCAVSLWHSISDQVRYGTTSELASLLRVVHELDAPADPALPPADPLRRVRSHLARDTALRTDDRQFITDLADSLAMRYEILSFPLGAGVVHGDANFCNVFLDQHDRPVLGDLDTFAIGPRELDLVATATYHERLGWHSNDEYRGFVDTYGRDILDWPGYAVLADVTELELITWLAQRAGHVPEVAEEIDKRIATVRAGTTRRDWKPIL